MNYDPSPECFTDRALYGDLRRLLKIVKKCEHMTPDDRARDPRWCARLAAARSSLSDDNATPREDTRLPDRADFDPDFDPSAPIECEVCGGTMHYIAACKILCTNCGYRRDCSDP